ncbi:MAG: ATP phosphoribosyltransferase regulatory subunit [bacterium]|nr:ATP phosphoribosyltransferase regulatory subunit [Gammaproteobacteria bacterium]HIL94741.1 ATP phosphoribosyltransferase regulatory subunit [Pseudomonadales bacterium]
MSIVDRWLLPDGVEEVLPPEAQKLEAVRRQLLDQFQTWGYQLVIPPMVEFLESLLTGTGTDLDLKTFKVTDQVSGRMMGIRADITPQVARIDAHSLNQPGNVRLCYAGTVLHAKADNMLASRTPISVGAELFGDTGRAGDLEIVSLMTESVNAISNTSPHIELGDVGIFRQLVQMADLSEVDEEALFDLIQSKALPDLSERVLSLGLSRDMAELVTSLPTLCGDAVVLVKARQLFSNYPALLERLDNLEAVAKGLTERFKSLDIYYDLSELRGYNYHTGIVFAAFLRSAGRRVAKGGRYDDVGEVFGRARGATGFDIDLKTLATLIEIAPQTTHKIAAPVLNEGESGDVSRNVSHVVVGRWQKICELRAKGYIVVEDSVEGCTKQIIERNGQWQLVDI